MTDPDGARRFDPPRGVDVEQGGVWWPGRQLAWAQWDGRGWMAYASWSTAPGQRYLTWVEADRVRARPE